MKICIINNLYSPYDRGGAEAYAEKISKGFLDSNHEVFIISTKPFNGKLIKNEGVYYLNSLYYNLDKFPKVIRFFWHIFGIFNVQKYLQIRRILKKEKPELVVTNNLLGLGSLVPRLLSRKKIKHLHVLHDIQLLHPSGLVFLGKEEILNSFFANIYQKINSYLCSDIRYVVSPSKWLWELHSDKNFFKKSVHKILFNPVIPLVPGPEKTDNNQIDFLYVGQLEIHKGLKELLVSLKDLISEGYDINLSIVGSGSLERELKEQFNDKRIVFFGKLEKKEVLRMMNKSTCLLAPSLCYENSPTVIYEAAICNLDFIYSDLGGASEIGEYFNGIKFNQLKEDSFKNIIIEYMENKKKYSNKSYKVRELNIDTYIKKIFEFLEIN